MNTYKFDVVVVGAGPAGSSAAVAASKHGINVLLIDSKNIPGTPVQCAEYVPRIVKKYVSLPNDAIVQKIDTLLTFINDELVSTLNGPGYMLDRKIFDGSLVQDAIESGAEFLAGAKAISKTERGIIVSRLGSGTAEITCKVIIGADGPRSTVGHWMDSVNEKFMIGLQYKLPLCKLQKSTDIYFKPEYEGGYAWIFPKGEYANIGLGVNILYKNKLQSLVKEFVDKLVERGIVKSARPIDKTGGLIPVGGPLHVTQKGNMMLIGDAAGQTHPVTGGGIMNGIVSGRIAGETAAQAIIQKDLDILGEYPEKWQSFLGRYLDNATQQRREMDHKWTYDATMFNELIRHTWISFN